MYECSVDKKYDLSIIFEYVYERNSIDSKFLESVVLMYNRNKMWANGAVRFAVNLFAMFVRPSSGKIKYYFWGNKYQDLIFSLPSNEVCVVGGPYQLIFCIKNNCNYIPSMRLWKPLAAQLKNDCQNIKTEKLQNEIKRLEKKLKKYASETFYFIVNNDSLPIQRSAILAARGAGVSRAVCVQHGIFQSKANKCIPDGRFADLFLAINEHQKDLLTKMGIDSNKIYVFGYHSSVYSPIRQLSEKMQRRVCFIGQPWGKYDKQKGIKYLHIVKTVERIIMNSNMVWGFKPHPWETQESYLKTIENVVNISLGEAIEKYDVFVSLTSTALYEACWSGRVAVQIYDELYESDRYSDVSSICSLQYEDREFQRKLLSVINTGLPCKKHEMRSLAEIFIDSLLVSQNSDTASQNGENV